MRRAALSSRPPTALLSIALLSIALLFGALLPAQSGTFPLGQLRRMTWNAASTLTLGSVAAGDRAIELRFQGHASLGAVLTAITHRGTRADGTVALWPYTTLAPSGAPASLWKAVLRPIDSETPTELTAANAGSFTLYADQATPHRRALLHWDSAALPDPTASSSFWFELLVEVDAARPWRVTWQSRMGRQQRPNRNTAYTLDEVQAPIVNVQAPWIGRFERLLVPIAIAFPAPFANLPLQVWTLPGLAGVVSLEHPARDQQMQFSGLYSGTPLDVPMAAGVVQSSYRKVLYMTTEDATGYYKQFQHSVTPGLGTLTYRWAPVYFPIYGPSPSLNSHASPYPAVLEAIQAKTDSWWYDCTETYRGFVDAAMGLTRIADPSYALNPDFPRAAPFVATAVIDQVNPSLPAIYPRYTEHAKFLQQVFDGADGRTLPTFMEWQFWLKGDPTSTPYPGRVVQDPIGPDFNPRPYSGAYEAYQEPPQYVIDEIAAARAAGINMSVYTLPIVANRADWPGFDERWFLRDRDGTLAHVGSGATGNRIDFGQNGVARWMADVLYEDIFDAVPGLGGVFLDVLSGGGSDLRYPMDPEKLFTMRRYHGGARFVAGTQELFDRVRFRLAQSKPTSQHPDIPFIPSETVQEYTAGRFDFGQQGLKDVPMQLQIGPLYDDYVVGLPRTSPEAQNPSPPLWNAVYHEWSRAEGLTVPLNVKAVSALLGGTQVPNFGTGQFGATWQQWGNYMRMVHALWWFQGMKPTSFQYLYGLEAGNLLVDDGTGHATVRDPLVPQEQQLVDFLRLLHHALDRHGEAGQFLSTGRLERPLQTPGAFNPALVTQVPNPTAVLEGACSDKVGVFHFYETAFTKLALYNTPQIFHAVWRSVETGELGVVFVNWTDSIATWEGTFDPSLYGGFGSGSFTVVGVAPSGAGVTEYVVGTGTGPTKLTWNPFTTPGLVLRHHSTPVPSFMPPRSVQVFVVRPQ